MPSVRIMELCVTFSCIKVILTFMTVHRQCILLITTNKMQRYTIFFIIVNALHVSAGFSAHLQELNSVNTT
jgi:hypothetical protein